MNQKPVKFDNTVTNDLNSEKRQDPQNSLAQKRLLAKRKLISKFGVSEEEAEQILIDFERKTMLDVERKSRLNPQKQDTQIKQSNDNLLELKKKESKRLIKEKENQENIQSLKRVDLRSGREYKGDDYVITPQHEPIEQKNEINSFKSKPKMDEDSPYNVIAKDKIHNPKPQVEPKAEPKAEPKVEPQVEPQVEPKAELKVEPQVESKVESKVESSVVESEQVGDDSSLVKPVIGEAKPVVDESKHETEDLPETKEDIKQEIEEPPTKQKSQSPDVDDILSDIIPDYNQHISIEVNHVDLTFEVSNEKIDTIKESFIRTIKRNKSKKLEIHALNDVSFKVYKGEKVGIIGYNGAGKSTLLNVISGIYPPDSGFVKTSGKISPLLSLGAGFDHNYSGRKNIFLNGAVLGYDKKFLESKVNEIIEFSELGEFIDIPIKNYSSGMLAKLGFSIATAVEPDILIIDEILGVGDVNFAKKSRDKIHSLMDGGTTVLLVSHSIPQVRELCDKAIWVDKGEIREIGEVNKVCDHYLKDAEKASNEQLANIQFR